MKELESSIYVPVLDTIYLSKGEVDNYGVATLHHELLHAGLEKAVHAGVISQNQYQKASELNIEYFSHLDGYIGTAQGKYQRSGYAYQEAFVIGWSWVKINSLRSSLSQNQDPMIKNALRYRDDITNNKLLKRLRNSKEIHMVHSKPIDVKANFLRYFWDNNHAIKKLVNNIENRSKDALPNLCRPGKYEVLSELSCGTDGAVYQNSVRKKISICNHYYQYSEPVWTSCGRLIRHGR